MTFPEWCALWRFKLKKEKTAAGDHSPSSEEVGQMKKELEEIEAKEKAESERAALQADGFTHGDGVF